jgi:hypothetical protein
MGLEVEDLTLELAVTARDSGGEGKIREDMVLGIG